MTDLTKMDYEYTGEERYQPVEEVAGSQGEKDYPSDPQGRKYYPYLPALALKKAVNLAIALKRPLLLEGEPGCGKTRLANAIAYEFTQKNLRKQKPKKGQEMLWWKFYIWNVKSTTRARDGFYTYDAVGRLRDAQLIGSDPDRLQQYLQPLEVNQLKDRLGDKSRYLTFGKFGEALREQTYRPILLIDEIDKADSDFPNDLLLELDELRFEIPETGDAFAPPTHKPIILITSNREKPLPEPFLRRCLYFYVPFPDAEHLRLIIQKRFGKLASDKETVVKLAVEKFEDIRKLLEKQPGSRPPGTSEFLEFLTALIQEDKPIEEAIAELENLAHELQLGILGTLIKTKADQDLYLEQAKKPMT